MTIREMYKEICKYCEPYLKEIKEKMLVDGSVCKGCVVLEKYGKCKVYERQTQMSKQSIYDIYQLIYGGEKMTVAEYIRQLTDEELKLFLYHNKTRTVKGLKKLEEWLGEEANEENINQFREVHK